MVPLMVSLEMFIEERHADYFTGALMTVKRMVVEVFRYQFLYSKPTVMIPNKQAKKKRYEQVLTLRNRSSKS